MANKKKPRKKLPSVKDQIATAAKKKAKNRARKKARIAAAKKQVLKLMKEFKPNPGSKKYALTSPAKVIIAIEESRGNKELISRRLNVSRTAFLNALQRDGEEWDLVRRCYDEECDRITDIARDTVEEMIEQRCDLNVAARTAMWALERRDPKFSKQETIKLEGGKTPIQMQAQQVIAVDSLNLPIAIKRALLKAMEEREQNQNGKTIDLPMSDFKVEDQKK